MRSILYLCLGFLLGAPGHLDIILAGDERAAEPAEAEQKKAEKKVKDLYKADYQQPTIEKMAGLAQKLLQRGREERGDPPTCYVLLREARDLALLSGDGITGFEAVEEMAKVFRIDAVSVKRSAAASAAKSSRIPEAVRGIVEACLVLVHEAAAADDYEGAKKMLGVASRNSRESSIADTLRDLSAEVSEIQKRHQALKNAEKLLRDKPEDPGANLAMGKFRSLIKDDWVKGLPMLAKGSDLALVKLAEEDLASPKDPLALVDLGNGWIQASEKSSGAEKLALKLRGARWQAQACPALEGLAREKVLQGLSSFALEVPSTRLAWEGIGTPPGFVVVKHNGKDQRGWVTHSGLWKFGGQIASDDGNGKDRYIFSTLAAHWVWVVFEFKDGSPGLTFTPARGELSSRGVNLDTEAKWNTFHTGIDMTRWHVLRLERKKDRLQVFFDDRQYNDLFLDSPTFLQVKANRGELRVRKLIAIGYNP